MENESPEKRINEMMPSIHHYAIGGHCEGRIVVKVGVEAQFTCQQCGAVVGVINPALLIEMLTDLSRAFNSIEMGKAFEKAMTALSALNGQTAVDRAELVPPQADPARYLLWTIDNSKEIALLRAAIGRITSNETEQLEDRPNRRG